MGSTSGDDYPPKSSYSNDDAGDSSSDDSLAHNHIPKKPKLEEANRMYSDKSLRMMQKMGYNKDKGLGKLEQGRIEPIEASEQQGRRGLGLKMDDFDAAALKFESNMEHIQLQETVEWLHNSDASTDGFSRDELEDWLVVGKQKLFIDDEDKFCSPDILREVLNSKTIFDNLGADDMRRARNRSNPFETIRSSIFLNRAAVKMANMDSILEFMFTKPIDEHGGSLVRPDDLLYFADVCAGPGGFSEYILWRKGWQAKGFGFTLQKENDFKLHEFIAGTPETFDPYYGCNEDGNVFDPENIDSLTKYVLSQTQGLGVHFMMADGGFSVENQENLQEILSKQLYLCQFLVAISIIREHGHFVVKLFDLFTPFSIGLLYLIHKCFQQISIFKPNTSRPASSERYLVCKWKKANTDTIQRHFFEINKAMWDHPNTETDVLELVPMHVLKADEKFFNYIYESNNRIGRNQVAALLKIAAYCKDTTLKETSQQHIRKECLHLWRLPDEIRKAKNITENEMFQHLMGPWLKEMEFLSSPGKILTDKLSLPETFRCLDNWYFVPLEVHENTQKTFRTFFMSKGGFNVLYYSETGSWKEIGIYLEMSPNSLIYGEIVKELTGEGRSQTIVYALHIIDGIVLGGVDIRNFPLKKRLQMCEKFANALNKPNKSTKNPDGTVKFIAPISCKKLYCLRDFSSFFDRLKHYKLKDGPMRLGQEIRNLNGPARFFVPRGLLFFYELKPNLQIEFSRTHKQMYFFDKLNNKSFFENELPDRNVIYASFRSTFTNRKLWLWSSEDQVNQELNMKRDDNLLYRIDIDEFILQKSENN